MLNYFKIVKLLGYKKKAITIFAEMNKLIQYLESVVTKQRTIFGSITLVVILNLLHKDFEITIAPYLYSGNKNFKKIQQIVLFNKAANIAKHANRVITNLTIMAKKNTR